MPKPSPRLGKTTALQFEHPQQHSVEAFDRCAMQARQSPLTPRDALVLAEFMLSHGHPDTLRVNAVLKQNPHRDVVAVGVVIEKCFHNLRRQLRVEDVDRKQIVRAYRRDGYLLFESPQKSRKLVVVFTTIFNNFYISHLNLQAMLKDLGCHLLFLKETTLANYQRGVVSFASDFPDIAEQIRATARQLGAEQIYISGFSSGGYAALLTSLRLPCHGYLGFSHATDLSPRSSSPRPWYLTDEVYAQLDQRWLVDLRVALQDADPSVPRVLCYGDGTNKDSIHARHVAGLPSIRLVRLARATHNTIQYLLAKGRLTAAFSQLVADR
jgi:pimeloyl-ACP methyl ester carboxylesterase